MAYPRYGPEKRSGVDARSPVLTGTGAGRAAAGRADRDAARITGHGPDRPRDGPALTVRRMLWGRTPGQGRSSYSARLMSARSEERFWGRGRHQEWRAIIISYTIRAVASSHSQTRRLVPSPASTPRGSPRRRAVERA